TLAQRAPVLIYDYRIDVVEPVHRDLGSPEAERPAIDTDEIGFGHAKAVGSRVDLVDGDIEMLPDERPVVLSPLNGCRERGNPEEEGGQRHHSEQHQARRIASHRLLTPFMRRLLYPIIAQTQGAASPNNWVIGPHQRRRKGRLSKNGLRKVDCDRLKV